MWPAGQATHHHGSPSFPTFIGSMWGMTSRARRPDLLTTGALRTRCPEGGFRAMPEDYLSDRALGRRRSHLRPPWAPSLAWIVAASNLGRLTSSEKRVL